MPDDPVGEAVAPLVAEVIRGASVELCYSPAGEELPLPAGGPGTATASGDGPPGWTASWTVRLSDRITSLLTPDSGPLLEILAALPAAALRTTRRFASLTAAGAGAPFPPAVLRTFRDTLIVEALSGERSLGSDGPVSGRLIAETVEFLIELGGTRVEAHDLTHGVVITDVLHDVPRLQFDYPRDLRTAKRAPLLFDGQRSLLVVDRKGRARTELQRHRLDHLIPGAPPLDADAAAFAHSGSLVQEATRRLGGIGFFLRADRTIWVFARGRPILVRRAEHWSAFPLALDTVVADASGGDPHTAALIVQAAFIISADRHGAILAIAHDAAELDGFVSPKDRYDLRNGFDPNAMQTETRLHHLIDAEELDALTLARLAGLDGATILDRSGHLLAYGAIVTSADSAHEGARTAAAKTLSRAVDIVLKVSADGDIVVFSDGEVVATLLQ